MTEDDLKSWGGSITNQGGDANADAISDGHYIKNVRPWRRWMARIRLSPNMVLDWIPAYPRRSACWAPLTPRCPKSSKAACTGWNKDTTFQVMAGTY